MSSSTTIEALSDDSKATMTPPSTSSIPAQAPPAIEPTGFWRRPFAVFAGHRGRGWQIAAWTLVVLLVVRLVLPYILLAGINAGLRGQEKMSGVVGDLTLGIISGDIILHDVYLNTEDPSGQVERLVEVGRLRAHLSWPALLTAHLVGALDISRVVLRIHPDPTAKPEEHHPFDERTWRSVITSLVPMRITAITIEDSAIRYDDRARDVHTSITEIQGSIRDLGLPAADRRSAMYSFSARTPGDGSVSLEGTALAAQEKPHATLKAKVEHVDLPKLNALITSYEGIGFTSGTFSGFFEAALDGQDLTGEFKPIFKHLTLATFKDSKGEDATGLFWKVIVPVAAWVLKNSEEDQHAARIPIAGRVDDPKTDLWTVFTSALGNAFVSALVPGFDGMGQSWVTPAKGG